MRCKSIRTAARRTARSCAPAPGSANPGCTAAPTACTDFTDYRIAQIEDKIVPMLSDGTYYKASETYIEMCADTLDFYAEKGAPLDSGNDPAKGWIKWVFVFVIPLAVACIVCGIFYAQMKTANEQTHANAYMPAEGLALSVVEDTYTHTTEIETYDPVKDDSSSS